MMAQKDGGQESNENVMTTHHTNTSQTVNKIQKVKVQQINMSNKPSINTMQMT